MDCVRDWNCLSTMLSSEKYYGIISILHLAGRLWLWASTTQVRVDMLFDDAWCICTQGGENTSQFHKFQYRLIHLHTLRSFVWDFCVSEALTRGWKVLWMMHGTCTPCWGSVWNDNFDTLKIRLRPCFVLFCAFEGWEFAIGKRTTFHWSRSCSLEGSLCHWMMTESDSWLTATRATRCRLHRWDESSMNSMFIAMQYCANTFYILLIWFLQDFCVQVPSRDNILMNLQWSNAQCTWLDHTMRVYFVDFVDLYFVYFFKANCIFGWKLLRSHGPKVRQDQYTVDSGRATTGVAHPV